MKRNFLFKSMLAMAGVFAVTSCSQDDLYTESEGDFVNATFTIETPEGILSRAVGDGTSANVVTCAVFDANGEEMSALRQDVAVEGKKATYSVRLAKGQDYRVAFFAYNKDANAYDVKDMKNIKVNDKQLSNVEARDAFTAYVDVKGTTAAINQDVTLYRPFAQLNLGAYKSDVKAAKKAGIVVEKSQVTVSNVYTAFSAYDDAVVGGTSDVTFALNAIPDEDLKADVNGDGNISDDEEFEYLALNYILVGDKGSEKSLTDVKFVWGTEDGKTNNPISEFSNIPVQRNYRTNIIGSLLTSPADFNIVIDADFENPDYNSCLIFNVFDLQAALDAAPVGETTIIKLGANLKGDVIEFQKADRNVVIDGCGYKYDGTIKIHSGSNYNNGAIVIKNVNFETETPDLNFIMPNEFGVENGVTRRYSSNVTVDNCTFTAKGAAENTVCGVQAKASRNLQVLNCTANDMHSLVQAQSIGNSDDVDVIVKGATINGGKNGVAFKQVEKAVVESSTINADGYGIRFDGNVDNYAITVTDVNVTATQPFIVRKMTGNNNTIALAGTNTLTSTADAPAYQIIITNGSDDEAYSVPTGTYTLTGADDFLVYPDIVAQLANVTEATTVELNNNITVTSGTTIHTENATADITIKGNGHSIISTANSIADFSWDETETLADMSTILSSDNGSTVTVNDLSFEGTMSALSLGHYQSATYNNYNTILNNVNVVNTKVVSYSANISPAVFVLGTAQLNNCDIYGTTLSELDTNPMWPVYDLAVGNFSTTTIKGGKVGSIFTWRQCKLTVDGAEVESISGDINGRTSKDYGLYISGNSKVGEISLNEATQAVLYIQINIASTATVGTLNLTGENIDLSKITIEDGAKVGRIIVNGVRYSLAEFKAL